MYDEQQFRCAHVLIRLAPGKIIFGNRPFPSSCHRKDSWHDSKIKTLLLFTRAVFENLSGKGHLQFEQSCLWVLYHLDNVSRMKVLQCLKMSVNIYQSACYNISWPESLATLLWKPEISTFSLSVAYSTSLITQFFKWKRKPLLLQQACLRIKERKQSLEDTSWKKQFPINLKYRSKKQKKPRTLEQDSSQKNLSLVIQHASVTLKHDKETFKKVNSSTRKITVM